MRNVADFARCHIHRFDTFKDRFRLEHHALAAAEWAVIHGLVAVMRKGPQIVDFDCHQAGFPSPANDSVIQWSAKEIRKDRDHVDLHRGTRTKSLPPRHRVTEVSY